MSDHVVSKVPSISVIEILPGYRKIKIGISDFNVGVQCVKPQLGTRLWILLTASRMREREAS